VAFICNKCNLVKFLPSKIQMVDKKVCFAAFFNFYFFVKLLFEYGMLISSR